MACKRPLSISPIRQRASLKDGICPVCGDKARIVNYGALSCSSCKTFFRRHGFDVKDIPSCRQDANCCITIETRKYCTACRFAKCLLIGMSPDLIRKEDLFEKFRSKTKSKRKLVSKEIISLPQPCPLNLLSDDYSSLTLMNWRLLSNVVNAFDTYNPILETKRMVKFVINSPRNIQRDMENTLNIIANIHTSLQSFVNCTADFRVMTTAEQCSLIQRNMRGMWTFVCMFVLRESGAFDNKNTENTLLPVYGDYNVQRTKHISQRFDPDLTLDKLMLITLAFSSNCFTINYDNNMTRDSLLYGTFRLFGSQNVYAELLWKYMTYRYGYWEAAQRFEALIKVAIDGIKLTSDIYESNKVHQDFTDELSEKNEYTIKSNGPQNHPLWGKSNAKED